MKRIGLVTLYNSNNYGAMLQAYALQKSIEKNNCECQIIQHDRFDSVPRSSKQTKKRKSKRLFEYASLVASHPVAVIKERFNKDKSGSVKNNSEECEVFRKNHFPNITPHFYGSHESILNDPPICDGLVCGSDQIWNPSRFNTAAPFFLDFGSDDITRISYAPSLATAKIPVEIHEQYSKWISRFDYVSVREVSGVKALSEVCGFEPECVLDPTFLLDRSEWDNIALSDVNRKKDFIFCYFLGRENFISASSIVKKLAKELDAEIVILPAGRHNALSKYAATDIIYGPKAFLGYIRDAKYVVTDSFHGTALSIIYRKQFSVFKARKKTASFDKFVRMEEILNSFDLADRVFTSNGKCITEKIDYADKENKISERITESKCFLKTALDSVAELSSKPDDSIHLAIESECTGCSACLTSCPTSAISMKQKASGFWYPYIDSEKCIKCGACQRKCPVLKPVIKANEETERFIAIYSKDKEFRAAGSSGNAFGLIVNAFKQQNKNAVIYGAAMESDCYSVSCKSTDEVNLKQLQKSKYLESAMGDAIIRMRDDLNSGKSVLFCGTPCQVNGIRSALGHRDGLLLCDFICHGTPSSAWFSMYLKSLEQRYNSKAVFVDFRPKLVGWATHCIYIKFENGHEYVKTSFADPYMTDFSRNRHLRKNCYNCNRVLKSDADLTIGDYWAARIYKNVENTNEGISIVRSQTALGEKYLNEIMQAPKVYAKELTKGEVDRTFIHRDRSIPEKCDIYPDEFPMHPKRGFKGWLRYFYYEWYVKPIKYHVREK